MSNRKSEKGSQLQTTSKHDQILTVNPRLTVSCKSTTLTFLAVLFSKKEWSMLFRLTVWLTGYSFHISLYECLHVNVLNAMNKIWLKLCIDVHVAAIYTITRYRN